MNNIDPNLTRARALYYRLWHYMVVFIATKESFEQLRALVDHLKNFPFDTQTQQAWQDWHAFLERGFEAFLAEQNAVLFAPDSSFVPMSASYYLEGQDNGKKRLEAIAILKQSGLHLESHTLPYAVSEDDLGFLTLMMNAFLQQILEGQDLWELHARLFKDFFHLFGDAFIEAIASHKKSICYQNCAIILSAFIKHERLFFNLISH
ncbi:TorD/DmsD family molecular chaperone [Helicobacter suis]|uniref:TorD/DmsD family molecular chaperone n=1 Tax=Helicobacter suis TaxID=104628 RepID=UPI0013D74989|nr:molecular chaperone TorD family protein [Helicobacter suis]